MSFNLRAHIKIDKNIKLPNMKVLGTLVKNEITRSAPKATGNLRNSFKLRTNKYSFNITSNAVYAAIQNSGGKIKVTEQSRKAFWALFYATSNEMYKHMALTKKTEFVIKAKNYINTSAISNVIHNYIKTIK